jgi:hypothetical protein
MKKSRQTTYRAPAYRSFTLKRTANQQRHCPFPRSCLSAWRLRPCTTACCLADGLDGTPYAVMPDCDDYSPRQKWDLRPISRRRFLANTCALSAGWLAGASGTATAERRPEIPRIRLTATPAICLAPQYVAEGLLEAEGLTDVQYVKLDNPTPNRAVASGDADISMDAVWGFMARVDAGEPVTMLAGVRLGCYEVFGTERVRSIRDLKGKPSLSPRSATPDSCCCRVWPHTSGYNLPKTSTG